MWLLARLIFKRAEICAYFAKNINGLEYGADA